ncbi:hypothetical protein Q1695_001124 [Nippostrongylus brasiliensis]|nr:hypothetical protein Q1695_001124 [Nippostrongylus brasiliensis]
MSALISPQRRAPHSRSVQNTRGIVNENLAYAMTLVGQPLRQVGVFTFSDEYGTSLPNHRWREGLTLLLGKVLCIPCPSCPSGYQCDTNTGICRPFRQVNAYPPSLSCGNCPLGTMCDTNTGTCRVFRYPGAYEDSTSRCAGVTCPTGYLCDNNTGTCRLFRQPTTYRYLKLRRKRRQEDLCVGVICPSGTQCDTNTGICRQFRPDFNPTSPDRCDRVICPDGMQCDSNTGICRQFRPEPYPSPLDKCGGVICPQGMECDSNTGICLRFRPIPTPTPLDNCDRVICPEGMECDSNTGICRKFRQPTPPFDLCDGVICQEGFYCNSNTGTCQLSRSQDGELCPANSYYSSCSTPCPETCNGAGNRCGLPCIATCVCNPGYVQASVTDMSCVLRTQCQLYQVDRCSQIRCQSDSVCIDGYCTPKNCPAIVKPTLQTGCRYILLRNVNNCLSIGLSC